jgi:hypothetical protein
MWKLPGLLSFRTMAIIFWMDGFVKVGLHRSKLATFLSFAAFFEQKLIMRSINFGSRAYFLRMVSFYST